MTPIESFYIHVNFPSSPGKRSILVQHPDETFGFQLEEQTISILNNGDNSWSLVKGDLSQEKVNHIGQAIEEHYKALPL